MMRKTVTISLPEELKRELDELTKEQGLSRSDIIRESLSDYLFVRRFRSLRNQMLPEAKSQGIYTDEDVFESLP